MKEEQYQCKMCWNIYEKYNDEEWNDDLAKQEMESYFGEVENPVIICDDCFQRIHPAKNPLLVQKCRNK